MAKVRKRTWTNSKGEQTAWIADYFDQAGKRHIKTFETEKGGEGLACDERKARWRAASTLPRTPVLRSPRRPSCGSRRASLKSSNGRRLRQYRNHVDLHIKPSRIGNEKLARLSAPAIEAFRDDLLRKCSRPMARKVLASLKSILGEAQRRGLVAQNAAQPVRVDVKKREQGKLAVGRDIPSKEEFRPSWRRPRAAGVRSS